MHLRLVLDHICERKPVNNVGQKSRKKYISGDLPKWGTAAPFLIHTMELCWCFSYERLSIVIVRVLYRWSSYGPVDMTRVRVRRRRPIRQAHVSHWSLRKNPGLSKIDRKQYRTSPVLPPLSSSVDVMYMDSKCIMAPNHHHRVRVMIDKGRENRCLPGRTTAQYVSAFLRSQCCFEYVLIN